MLVRVRCHDNSTVEHWLTVGKEYDAEGDVGDMYWRVIGDNGRREGFYQTRFTVVEPDSLTDALLRAFGGT